MCQTYIMMHQCNQWSVSPWSLLNANITPLTSLGSRVADVDQTIIAPPMLVKVENYPVR